MSMGKLEKARNASIALTFIFYTLAKVGCLGSPTNFGGMTSVVGNIILPVIVSIIATAHEAFGKSSDASFYAASLAIQISELGLATLSALLSYAIHIQCKENERR